MVLSLVKQEFGVGRAISQLNTIYKIPRITSTCTKTYMSTFAPHESMFWREDA